MVICKVRSAWDILAYHTIYIPQGNVSIVTILTQVKNKHSIIYHKHPFGQNTYILGILWNGDGTACVNVL